MREKLKYSRTYVYFQAIEKSYMGKYLDGKNPKFLGRGIHIEEAEFLKTSVNYLYLDKEVLSYRHKPILPICKLNMICKQYHNSLQHPNSMTLFEIISREFFVFPDKTFNAVENICNSCPLCSSIPEDLSKVR